MMAKHTYDVSVVMPFGDDEDVIGRSVRHVVNHLREYGVSFELVAVDEDSGDNCHAVLSLLRTSIPELRVLHTEGRGRGFAFGAQRAQGRVLWLLDPHAALAALAPFGRAYRRVARREYDFVMVEQRFSLCHRTKCLSCIDGLRGNGSAFHKRLARRAAGRRLAVDTYALGQGRLSGIGGLNAPRRWARLLNTIPGRLAALRNVGN